VGGTGRIASNVIATLPGTGDPSQVVVVSAHYDSTSDRPDVLAPGADDNASGTAAVIELARVLAGHEFELTIRLAAWGAEEQGLVGSRYHAERARQRGERIVADLTLDMIGYVDQAPEDLELIVHADSDWVYQRFAAAAAAYAPLPVVRQVRATFGSDCTSFWERGFPALCAIEDYPLRNPYYHRGTDTLETLDVEFVRAVTAATLATAADLAQPVQSPRTPDDAWAAGRASVPRD
jgi:Zn-dependent M28 family amino/carboxypeptidase